MFASVVIPTYRRDGLLQRCLERLLDQSLPAGEYEIIVCDDGPCESTRRLVESLHRPDGPELRYLPVTATQGPAAARNVGWRAARGTIIAFTDDDCLPDRDWLAAGCRAMAQADAVTGRTIVPIPDRPTDYERDTAGLASAEFITANCFVRRTALEDVGGFDERFTAAWREDSDLHFALLERGKRIIRGSDAVVVHPVRPAPWGVSLKLQWKGSFDPLLAQKHPRWYRRKIAPYPWTYYLVTGSLVVAAATGLVGWYGLSAAAALVWLATTLEFAVRRLRGAALRPSHVVEMVVTSALIPPLSLFWQVVGWLRYRGTQTGRSTPTSPPLANCGNPTMS